MDIDDHLDVLADQLPKVFEGKQTPWKTEDDWVFVPVERPDDQYPEELVPQDAETIGFDVPDRLVEDPFDEVGASARRRSVRPRRKRRRLRAGTWPGGYRPPEDDAAPPPPDAVAFYLPFHSHYPDWWGIYLIHDEVEKLARILRELAGVAVSAEVCRLAVQLFAYRHEVFHHEVECFATRLEVTHRRPLYRLGFRRLFQRQFRDGDVLEEALATAAGVKAALDVIADPEAKERLSHAFVSLIGMLPAAYRGATRYLTEASWREGRNVLAEQNQGECLKRRALKPDIWGNFPQAFGPFARVTSRVIYLLHKNSPLASRLRTDPRYLTYKDVEKRLRRLAQCEPTGQEGSHVKWRRPDGRSFPVPRHPGDLRPSTLKSIIRAAGLDMSLSAFARA